MGIFGSDFNKATSTKGGVYFTEGIYEVEVLKVQMIKSRKNESFFCVSTKIAKAEGAKALAPGMEVSWMAKVGTDMFMPNTKQFLTAAYSEALETPHTEDQIGEAEAEASVGEENPLGGTYLRLTVIPIKTRAGKDFSKHVWAPIKVKLAS